MIDKTDIIYKERKGTDSSKWDGCKAMFGKEDLLPLWVADMDFEVPLCVKEAIKEYVDFGVFGYYIAPDSYKEAFIKWETMYHGYDIKKEWIRFAPGVVPAINWIINILTQKDDSVIIMPPVYYPFKDAIINNKRTLVESPLVKTTNGYIMDYADFEKKIIDNKVKIFIFCSPHNPVGRVWTKDEIKEILDICKKHNVYVIADEIHQDIIISGNDQIAAATTGDYDEILITLTAASKTFNLAACQNSFVIIPDKMLGEKYDEYVERLRIKGGNPFGYIAVFAAYEKGRPWLDKVLAIIEDNYNLLKQKLEEALPDVWISDLQGTYLMWIDLGKYSDNVENVIKEKCGLAVDFGDWFGGDEYKGFIRVNLATKKENIEFAADKIIEAFKNNRRKR